MTCEGWIAFFDRRDRAAAMKSAFGFHRGNDRFLFSPISEMQRNLPDALPPEDLQPRAHGRKTTGAPGA
jgi:hypothetical protein